MKKLIDIIAVFLLAFSLTSCTYSDVESDDSLPEIDIVQRSQLLDMITTDHIFDDKDKQLMKDMGVSVSMSAFELESDDTASFMLEFVDGNNNKGVFACSAAIDYTQMGDGSFENIRFYWGGLTKAGDGLIITTPHTFYVWQPDAISNFTGTKLEFLRESNGYIVHTAYGFGKYAVMYTDDTNEGIVIFDSDGNETLHITDTVKDVHISGLLSDRTEEMMSDVPFSYKDGFSGDFINENLYLIFQNDTADVVDCKKQAVTATLVKNGYDLAVDNLLYDCWLINNTDTKLQVDYDFITLKKEDNKIVDSVIIDTGDINLLSYMGNRLSMDDSGNIISYNELSGIQFTMNFDSHASEIDYTIIADMLGEKIATSKDKNYSLYEYGKHSYNSHWISYLALKNEKTGDIQYVADYKGRQYCEHILESGFFSNGEIYLMTDYDFAIYNSENTESGPVFNLGEKFPLGISGDDGYKYNTLWAVRRDPEEKTFIAVYDHLHHEYFYTPPLSADEKFCDDTYDIALLDKDGNIIKTFTTEMMVPSDTNVLNISLSGNVLTMENVTADTGKTIQKSTLNIKTGEYKKIL